MSFTRQCTYNLYQERKFSLTYFIPFGSMPLTVEIFQVKVFWSTTRISKLRFTVEINVTSYF